MTSDLHDLNFGSTVVKTESLMALLTLPNCWLFPDNFDQKPLRVVAVTSRPMIWRFRGGPEPAGLPHPDCQTPGVMPAISSSCCASSMVVGDLAPRRRHPPGGS